MTIHPNVEFAWVCQALQQSLEQLLSPQHLASKCPKLVSAFWLIYCSCVQGNALGKGPVLFCVSAKGLRQLSAAAAAGDATYQQLELDMNRLAGGRPRLGHNRNMEAPSPLLAAAGLEMISSRMCGNRPACVVALGVDTCTPRVALVSSIYNERNKL